MSRRAKAGEAETDPPARDEERRAWRAENRRAIEEYNEHVEKHGLFSDRWRRF